MKASLGLQFCLLPPLPSFISSTFSEGGDLSSLPNKPPTLQSTSQSLPPEKPEPENVDHLSLGHPANCSEDWKIWGTGEISMSSAEALPGVI